MFKQVAIFLVAGGLASLPFNQSYAFHEGASGGGGNTGGSRSSSGVERYLSECEARGVDSEIDSIRVDGYGKVLNGKKCGEWTIDYGLDRVQTGTFVRDKKHGYWHEVGQFEKLVHEGYYKNGRKEGPWIEHFNDYTSEKAAEGEYKSDKKHGRWEVIYKTRSGVSQRTEIYRHGILLEEIKH